MIVLENFTFGFFINGITIADFNLDGNVPVEKAILTIFVM